MGSAEPGRPWANIGYWGDHQIIYLLKLLEWTREFYPQGLDRCSANRVFTHANVPYRIKNSMRSSGIRVTRSSSISTAAEEMSAASATSVQTENCSGTSAARSTRVTLVEKLLTLSLAKLSNFIPDGGIWLNTQRPEWNDANNALVGNGLSMVTACYLHRWCKFLHDVDLRDASDDIPGVAGGRRVLPEQIEGHVRRAVGRAGQRCRGSGSSSTL